MRPSGLVVGLLLCATTAGAQRPPRPATAEQYARVRAALTADSVRGALAGHPVIIDPVVRLAPARFAGRKLQFFPVAYELAAGAVPALLAGGAAARTVQPSDTARGDTVLVSVAQVSRRAPPTFVVQLRSGADWTGYDVRTVVLDRSGARWVGRQVMFGSP